MHGKRRNIGLGSHPAVSLADARKKGEKVREQVANGIDPVATRDTLARAAAGVVKLTYRVATEAYIEAHKGEWRNPKSEKQWTQTMTDYVHGRIGDMSIPDIDMFADVLEVLKPIWKSKTVTAKRLQVWMHMVFASTRGKPGGLPVRARNPAEWKDGLAGSLAKPSKIAPVKNHAALPWEEVPALMQRLMASDRFAASVTEIAILCGTRTKPVLHMKVGQIDRRDWIWNVPSENEKSGEPSRVPLGPRARTIIQARLTDDMAPDDYVFAGLKGRKHPRADRTCWVMLRRLGIPTEMATVHGFRSCLSTWGGEMTHHDRDVVEAALSHKFKGVRGDYQRGDMLRKRIALMNDYSAFCTGGPAVVKLAT